MSITNGSYQIVGEIGEIKSIYLSPGVYVDLAYDLKEIEYTVESLDAEEQKKYDDWVKAQEAYDKEDEVNVIRNSQIVLKKLQKIKNPLNDKEIYQIEGDVVGFKDIKLEPKKEFAMDAEMLELFNLFKK
jgi:hypothetical protein